MPVTMATIQPPLASTLPLGLYSLVVSGREKELSLWQAAAAENQRNLHLLTCHAHQKSYK